MRLRHIRLRHTGTPAVIFALVMAAALTACSGGDKQAEAKKLTAAEQLASAKAKADAATSMHLMLRSSGIPETANGVLAADGSGTHAPAFKATLDARIAGFSAKVEVVAIDKLRYLKLPGANIVKRLKFGAGAKTVDLPYGITDPGGELRGVTLVGPFFKGATSTPVTSTYVLTLDKYGAPVEISKP